MSNEGSRFVNLCPVFLSQDIRKTVQFYTEKLGFKSAKHYDKVESFATIYRDEIEFVIVQALHGEVMSNSRRHGAGNDAYINTATVEGIDPIYREFKEQGVKMLSEPHMTAYGSYEFAFEDIDGRQIGVGRIRDAATYFKESNFLTP